MKNVNAETVYSILIIIVALAAIAGFYLGRRKEAVGEGVNQGTIVSDITYIKKSMDDMKSAVEKVDRKLDDNRKETEKEIRELLISYAELNSSYKSLHKRMDRLEERLGGEVQNGI